MTLQGWAQIAFYIAVLTALTPLLGGYMARVYQGQRTFLDPVVGPLERFTYRAVRVDQNVRQRWKAYGRTMLVFSALFFVVLYAVLRTQAIHPFQPGGFHSGPWDVSFNTAGENAPQGASTTVRFQTVSSRFDSLALVIPHRETAPTARLPCMGAAGFEPATSRL